VGRGSFTQTKNVILTGQYLPSLQKNGIAQGKGLVIIQENDLNHIQDNEGKVMTPYHKRLLLTQVVEWKKL